MQTYETLLNEINYHPDSDEVPQDQYAVESVALADRNFAAASLLHLQTVISPTRRLWTDDGAAILTKLTRGCGSLGAESPEDCREEGCCEQCTGQACSRVKTGSQDGSSLIRSKWGYNLVYTMMCLVYTLTYSYVLCLHHSFPAHVFFSL